LCWAVFVALLLLRCVAYHSNRNSTELWHARQALLVAIYVAVLQQIWHIHLMTGLDVRQEAAFVEL
jgi:hypothetical protein